MLERSFGPQEWVFSGFLRNMINTVNLPPLKPLEKHSETSSGQAVGMLPKAFNNLIHILFTTNNH
jgi:hypothetical protein